MVIHGNQKKNRNFSKISAHNARRDTFTFLKSNYKYKRRFFRHHRYVASQWRSQAISTRIATATATTTTAECNSINKVISNTSSNSKWRIWMHDAVTVLLRMLLLIIRNSRLLTCDKRHNFMYAVDGHTAATIDAHTSNDDVNVDGYGDEMDFQRIDVKVLPITTTITQRRRRRPTTTIQKLGGVLPLTMSSPRSSSTPSSILPSTTTHSSTLLPFATHYGVARITDKPFTFLAALFIAFALCARSAAAGACWQTVLDTGKCNEIYSLNITKAECCGRSQEFSFTERDLTEVEYFFATAIGGGMECAPCIESCKGIQCGVNKECVKRKGRPKCICAPKCGAAARRRRQQQQQQEQEKQLQQRFQRRKHYRGHLHHNEQLPRDIRSLSSEITNFNLGLDTRGDAGVNTGNVVVSVVGDTNIGIGAMPSQRHNQNQRKILILQSQQQHQQKNHHNYQHHNQHHQRPKHVQARSQPVKSGKRIVIIGNVEPTTDKEHLTRRIQMISNVMKDANGERFEHPFAPEHKSNGNNEENEQLLPKKVEIHRKNNNISCSNYFDVNQKQNHNNINANKSNCNTSILLGYTHEHINGQYRTTVSLNDADDNVGGHGNDHHVVGDKDQREHRRQKTQRKRKHQVKEEQQHHRHRFHNRQELHQHQQQHQQQHQHYHQHRHRSKQHQKQKMQFKKQQQKQRLKDHQKSKQQQQQQQYQPFNKTTMTTLMLPENASTSFSPAFASTLYTSSTITATQRITKPNPHQQAPLAQTATPANSATSLLSSSSSAPGSIGVDRHYSSNHGSISTTSSTMQPPSTFLKHQQQSAPASKTTQSSSVSKISGGAIVGVGSTSPTTNDDFTLLDGIYDNFNLHGFPNQDNEDTNFEIIHHNSHPVCGTDGRTYNTECQLKKRACRTNNSNLQVAYRGHCKTSCNGVKCLNSLTCVEDHYMIPHCIACKIECPQNYGSNNNNNNNADDDDVDVDKFDNDKLAVCGVDGKTYRSVCDINRMICKIGRSIAVAYPGPCRADRITCNDINCGPKHKCLVDLLTHEPRCVSCRYKCSRKRHPTALRYEEGKICGVNNRTYNSWCEMRKDSCMTGYFIDVKSAGQCH